MGLDRAAPGKRGGRIAEGGIRSFLGMGNLYPAKAVKNLCDVNENNIASTLCNCRGALADS